MDSEAKIVLAFLFNRSGKTLLSEAELYLPLSMELGWFSTKEAQQFVRYVVKRELVVRKEGMLTPNFPVDSVKIPIGFTPSKKTFNDTADAGEGKNCVEEIITLISEYTYQEKTRVAEEIKKEEEEKNLFAEVAALLVARRQGVDVSEWYPFIEKFFMKGNTG